VLSLRARLGLAHPTGLKSLDKMAALMFGLPVRKVTLVQRVRSDILVFFIRQPSLGVMFE
jgi:uncharacterized membrane protein